MASPTARRTPFSANFRFWAAASLAMALLSGCSSPTRTAAQQTSAQAQAFWSGRMGLQVHDETAAEASFSASFQLQGSATTGQLDVFSPLGSQIAQLTWQPSGARLQQGNRTTQADTLDTLVQQSLGTDLPVQAMFAWLQGHATTVDGWEVDLSRHTDGRITAQRLSPPPQATLRLVLDQP